MRRCRTWRVCIGKILSLVSCAKVTDGMWELDSGIRNWSLLAVTILLCMQSGSANDLISSCLRVSWSNLISALFTTLLQLSLRFDAMMLDVRTIMTAIGKLAVPAASAYA